VDEITEELTMAHTPHPDKKELHEIHNGFFSAFNSLIEKRIINVEKDGDGRDWFYFS
jgi:hypothetical protein